MPYRWVEPDLLLEVDGVAVYHCYDDAGELCWYWYTTDPNDDNVDWSKSDTAQFDVRDLPDLGLNANDSKTHARIIEQAIRDGLLSGEPALKQTPLKVTIEVIGGVAHLLEKPDEIEVEILDRDLAEGGDPSWPD